MDELETRMHTGLTQLAEPMAEAPELEQVASRGRQLRQRRRIAGIAGGAAAVLVVASGLSLVLGSSIFANNGRVAVVATPSPTPSLGSPIGTSEAHIALPPNGSEEFPYDVRFVATRTLSGVSLKATAVTPTSNFSMEMPDQDRNPGGFNLDDGVTGGSGFLVGMITDQVSWFDAVSADLFAFRTYTEQLPGLGMVYVVVPGAGVKLSDLQGLTWSGSDGQVRSVDLHGKRDAPAQLVPMTRFDVGGHTGTLFSVEHYDLLALVDYDGLGYSMNVREAQGTCRLAGSSTKAVGQDEVWTSLAICPLPIGSTQITPVLAPGITTWKTVMVGDRPVLLVPSDKGKVTQIVTGLRFTDGAGKPEETKVG